MKEYSKISAVFMSFFSKNLYRDVAKNWKGVSFFYLFLLLAVCTIPSIIELQKDTALFSLEAPELINQLPKITVTDGTVSIDKPIPYYIKDPQTGRNLAIIDTSGKTKNLQDSEATILVTDKQFMTKKNDYETTIYDLNKIKQFSINKNMIFDWLHLINKWFALSLYPLIVILSFMFHVIQVLIYGAIGKLFTKMGKKNLGYQVLVRISVIAITPGIVLGTILQGCNIQFPLAGLVSIILAMLYLLYGISVNDSEEIPTPQETPVIPTDNQ
ncbi:MAG: DUF1189 family protein [Candidatus Ancaeobacter aquaticus]|nr:DUF1189 family protein [Candidatus Ancaeobacter aquaticus]